MKEDLANKVCFQCRTLCSQGMVELIEIEPDGIWKKFKAGRKYKKCPTHGWVPYEHREMTIEELNILLEQQILRSKILEELLGRADARNSKT